jgi:dienelactone hydrolase
MSRSPRGRAIVVDGETSTPRTVTLRSANPFLLTDAGDGDAEPQEVPASLYLPDGNPANRPAVVIVQGLGGPKAERELTYGHKLARAGCVALALDSFEGRDLDGADDKWKALRVSTWAIMADTFAALELLAGHPAVNRDAIAAIGFSWGGMATMLAAYEQIGATYLGCDGPRFAGHVAYYGCSIPRLEDPRTTGAPVMILVGAHDENISVERTRRICEEMRRGGSDVELKVLDAYHQWDGEDEERRHVLGSLADIHVTVTRNNELVDERSGAALDGPLPEALVLMRDLRWSGYDIQRDEDLHRESDRLLLEFIDRVARDAGAERPDVSAVPLGSVGRPRD